MKLLSATQCKELDRFTIENEPIPSLDLMERAALALAREISYEYPLNSISRIVCFAGPGNNGGDALAVARLLSASGYATLTFLFNTRGKLSPDCAFNRDLLLTVEGAQLVEVTEEFDFPTLYPDTDIVVDGLFGTGLNHPLEGGFASLVRHINDSEVPVVSLDIPSGLMSEDNSFNNMNYVVRADLTLTIQLPKPAFLFPENEPYVGEWRTVDIGLLEEGINQAETAMYLTEMQDVHPLLRKRSRFAHKGSLGHALLVCGSHGMAGAAQLAAESCLRSGVGKLTVHTPARNLPLLQTTVPEAIVSTDTHPDFISHAIEISSYSAVGIGPGLRTEPETATALSDFIRQSQHPLVLDADALNLLSMMPQLQEQLPPQSILTPHPKEFDSLAGRNANTYERIIRARELAVSRNLYIILKGHHTAICTPSGSVWFNNTGNPGMATPGSGDVLTGIITGLLAQGYAPCDAARLGVWLHGLAGDIAAERLGEECMLAGDIIKAMPEAFRRIRDNVKKANTK